MVIYLFSRAEFVKLLTGFEKIRANLIAEVRSEVSGGWGWGVNDGTNVCLSRCAAEEDANSVAGLQG